MPLSSFAARGAPRATGARRRPDDARTGLTAFAPAFDNPGALRMLAFVPPGLAAGAPLVVVLHGCTQTAAGFDAATGWSTLATAHGFALLFPEQVGANNANGCFNWFEPGDSRRGGGEAASIAHAVAAAVACYRLDRARVFVTGLSAGGAMANVMLAAYPDVFAGGAIIAGLPVGSATGVGQAMAAMAAPAALSPTAWGEKVRRASTFTGPWPTVSVWHGDADRTVAVANGAATAAQWADVHGATMSDHGDATACRTRTWRNAAGVVVVELHAVAGMGHGVPIDRRTGGAPAPFMLDVGIDAATGIAAFWGIAPPAATATATTKAAPAPPAGPTATPGPAKGIAAVIESTLRAAGLMP